MATRLENPRFVGRAEELQVLARALQRAEDGDPSVVVLGGEAGVGKTRLVEEFATWAGDRGARVLIGGNVELGEEGMPFAPVSAALRSLLRELAPDEAPTLLAPVRAELARLLPELGPVTAPAAIGRGRLFEALLDLIERVAADRPLVLVLEDMHWADRSTRDLLAFLTRGLRQSRVLIVVTYRSDELTRGHPLRPFLAELERVRIVERHQVERLTRAEVAEQVTALLGASPDPAVVDRVYERSGGNAFFVEELVCAELQSDLPGLSESLRELLLARVERLSPKTQQLLRIASASGRRIEYSLLAAVSDLPDDELTAALREAVSAYALIPSADDLGFSFRHSLVREALHEDLLPGEHGRVHVRYAQALEGNPSLIAADRFAAEVAHHWHAAHDAVRALPAALTAADAARDIYAFAEQQLMLERALETWDQVPPEHRPTGLTLADLLARAAHAAFNAGDHDRALALTDAALAEVDAEADREHHVILLEQRAQVLANLGRAEEVNVLRTAAALLTPQMSPRTRARVQGSLARALMLTFDGHEAMRLAEQAAALADEVHDPAIAADAEVTIGSVLVHYFGKCEEGIRRLFSVLEAAEAELEPWVILRARANLSDALYRLGRYAESAAVAREGVAQAAQFGRAHTSGAFIAGNFVEAQLMLGQWADAERLLSETLELRTSSISALALRSLQARLAVARGETEDAERAIALARSLLAPQRELPQFALPLVTVEAELDLLRGRPDDALTRLRLLLDEDHKATQRYDWPALATAARAAADVAERARDLHQSAVERGAIETARQLAEAGRRLATGADPDRAWQALVGAEVSRARGDGSSTEWRAAAADWESLSAPYLVAYASFRAAEAAVVAGDRSAAQDAARRAAAAASSLRAAPLDRDVTELARRARLKLTDVTGRAAPAPREDHVSRLGLTARELDVLRALAAGRSNRQIGEDLFISVKTVSVHVSNILAKLDVSTRGEAAAVAHRLRLFTSDRVSA